MTKKILVTGGAGFIGSHLVDELISNYGHQVTILDILDEQVHGKSGNPPRYLNPEAIFLRGSVADYQFLEEQMKDHEVIVHLAAKVGVGQSMYEIKKYIHHNSLGTANMLNILVNKEHDVKKLIIASSNTVYGEGKANCADCGDVYPNLRSEDQLKQQDWEVNCPKCGKKVTPIATDEFTPFDSSSIYALSKQSQEEMAHLIGKTYGINTTILRFFLVYGQRQALSNPYTGVCAIFSARLFNGKRPIVFEDGLQSRDFVNVKDICQGLVLALENSSAKGENFNLGSGSPITIKEVAEILSEKINPDLTPIYRGEYRKGDIRHCVADISKIRRMLGYEPKIEFKDGIDELIKWIAPRNSDIQDKSREANDQLRSRGLLK